MEKIIDVHFWILIDAAIYLHLAYVALENLP
jgi:hypothetical protein